MTILKSRHLPGWSLVRARGPFCYLVIALLCAACATMGAPPRPDNLTIQPVSPNTPPSRAAFLGAWDGVACGGRGLTLVISKIDGNKADVYYGWGSLRGDQRGSYAGAGQFANDDALEFQTVGNLVWISVRVVNEGALTAEFYRSKQGATDSAENCALRFRRQIAGRPDQKVLNDAAAFSGTWIGRWDGVLETQLTVRSVEFPVATLLYEWGSNPARNLEPGSVLVRGLFGDGDLMTILRNGAVLTFRVNGNGTLAGTYVLRGETSRATLVRKP